MSMTSPSAFLSLLTVTFLIICGPLFGQAAIPAKSLKSYAVFVASYNPKTGQAQGGIAGTAFFVTPLKAVTAWHVLQPKSFQPAPGFTKAQVWLVHENEPAIEVHASDISGRREVDMTFVNVSPSHLVKRDYIFAIGMASDAKGEVETQGFRANSAGPVLSAFGDHLKVTHVPQLERLNARGQIRQKVRVDLNANDVRLQSAPCLQLSYIPIVGLSGGPVVANGQVIAMNSFADPSNRQSTWAVDLKSVF